MKAHAPPSTVPGLLRQVVAARGPHDAVAMLAETVSYDELDARSARLARALLAIGAGKGTRIALMAPDGVFWITAYLASLRIGALLTLVSTLSTPPELAHILRHSDAQILIGARRFMRHDYAATLSAALPGLAEGRAEALRLTAAPYLRSIWLDDADGMGWAGPINALLARADAAGAPGPDLLAAVEAEVSPADDAVVVYTSGSTAKPKAVVHSQATVVRHPAAVAPYFLLKAGDRMLPQLPAFWLGGLVMAMQTLSVGATLVYPDSPEIDVLVETLRRLRVTRVNGWGEGLTRLRLAAAAAGIDVDAIVGLGPFRDETGEVIPPPLQVNMLGMSETFAAHSAERLDFRLPQAQAGSSGRTVNGYERRVVDPETGHEVPLGEIGELQLRGGGLMTGFYKVERDKVFTPDGFYPTGDLVRLDADGHLFFVARRGDMIKTKAANVSRLEVEAALRDLPGVELPLVVGLADPELGQMVVAAIVPTPGAALDEEAMKTALRERLSSYKVPRRIVSIAHEDIPRTATGKLKLFELADVIAARIGMPAAART